MQQTLKEAAEAVDALIAGIGRVENTSAFKNKIDAARAAYDALSAEAKALVSGLSALEKAERRLRRIAGELGRLRKRKLVEGRFGLRKLDRGARRVDGDCGFGCGCGFGGEEEIRR